MSLITFTTSTVVDEKRLPVANPKINPVYGVIGSVVKVDGRTSQDPDGNTLTYSWSFESVPIGSMVKSEGVRILDEDGGLVSFSPDLVGEYVIGLKVSNGVLDSSISKVATSIRATLVPHGRGVVPDGKWLWSYIRDVWQEVDNKEIFETLWSALIQIAGSELLKLYQVDFNKSISDIQDLFQRRWLSYEPRLEIKVNGPDFFIGKHFAGTNAVSINLGLEGSLIILNSSEVVLIEGSILPNIRGSSISIVGSKDSDNDTSYTIDGLNYNKNGYKLNLLKTITDPTADRIETGAEFIFSIHNKTWKIQGSDGLPYALLMSSYGSPLDQLLPLLSNPSAGLLSIRVGDIIHYKAGPNKGFYKIISKNNDIITVDKVPPAFSDSTTSITYKADIYRPVAFTLSQQDNLLTDTIAIPFDSTKDISDIAPGRILILNGQAYTILRASLDFNLRVPSVVIIVDRVVIQSGLKNLSWRTPPTLVSITQDFEEDGVSQGDLIVFDLVQNGMTSSIKCQVVGVDKGRLGFIFSNEAVLPGYAAAVPNDTILSLAADFKIDGVSKNDDGSLSYTGTAAKFLNSINSGLFHSQYWNKQLTPDTNITVNPDFQVKPKYILRNKLIPVDSTLRSIPLLQNYIAPPNIIENNGKFLLPKNGQDFELPEPSFILKENIDYLIDDEIAFNGQMVFATGSDIIETDDGDFIDRGIRPGDQFIITEPITLARTYYVQSILSDTKLKLTRPVPLYPFFNTVTAKVQIQRARNGRFLRFTPGQFTTLKPAPQRLWAEVSFFDNGENIENNFGLLVGITREDIEKVSKDLNYRQAVTGIMFAYLNGPYINKVRLGAQILLGLPFAENRGIVRSIENDYRLDVLGNPILGRLLIEDIDKANTPLGTLRVYTFPVDPASDLAGVAINPATSAPYQIGDIVEKFVVLSKGVEIQDYLTNPLMTENVSIKQLLQQYHSIRAKINDSVFTTQELDLVSKFLKKITPSYVAFFLTSSAQFADAEEIIDNLTTKFILGGVNVVDNGSFSIPPTIMLDSRNASGVPQIFIEDTNSNSCYWVRRSGKDLQTTHASNVVTITGGGITNPRTNESFEAPLTKANVDLLFIRAGLNFGLYPITALSDTTLTITGPTNGLEDGVNLGYVILRPIRMKIKQDTFTLVSGNSLITASASLLRTDGVSPGDFLVNLTNVTTISEYTILQVQEGTPGIWNKLKVSPTPVNNGSDTFAIIRSKLLESPLPGSDSLTAKIKGVDGTGNTTNELDILTSGLMEVGDIFREIISAGTYGREFLILDAKNLFIAPPLAMNEEISVQLFKKNKFDVGIGLDAIQLWDPTDIASMRLIEDQHLAACTMGSKTVSLQQQRTTVPTSGPGAFGVLTSFVKPTDMLKLEGAGNGAVDVGYGSGIYPIIQVLTNQVKLAVQLANTESVAWSIIRKR